MRGRRTKNITENIDWLLISIYAVMVLLGWLNIYAANYTDEAGTIFDFSKYKLDNFSALFISLFT